MLRMMLLGTRSAYEHNRTEWPLACFEVVWLVHDKVFEKQGTRSV